MNKNWGWLIVALLLTVWLIGVLFNHVNAWVGVIVVLAIIVIIIGKIQKYINNKNQD